MRPHIDTQESQHRRRRKHRYLRHRRVAAEERGEPQRTRGDLGHFVSGLLHLGQHHRQPPGHQSRITAGADDRSLHGRRLVPQRRVHAGGELQLLHGLQTPPAADAAGTRVAAVRVRHQRRLRLLSADEAAAQLDGSVLPGRTLVVGGPDPPRHLRCVLAVARSLAAHAQHHVRGPGGGRLVRRRGSRGTIQDIQGDCPQQSGDTDHARRGSLGPWRLGTVRRRAAGAGDVRIEDR